MIDHLTKEILDTAYRGFPAGQGMIASDDRFLEKNLEPLSKAIKEMFRLLNVDKDTSVLNQVKIFNLDQLDFAKACYCNTESQDYLYVNEIQTDAKAKEIYAKVAELISIDNIDNEKFEAEMLELNGRTFGCSNKSNVLLNKGAILPELGLHLVCHEIMHSLASPIAVNELREINCGDEAVNEFFARLATLIFNSMDEKKNPIIAGYTLWEGEMTYPHSKELGIYGSLMGCDKWLQDSAWENPYESVEFCKKMANYYFLK